jgi:hypothetical protein
MIPQYFSENLSPAFLDARDDPDSEKERLAHPRLAGTLTRKVKATVLAKTPLPAFLTEVGMICF